jgi:pyruvate carboxylase
MHWQSQSHTKTKLDDPTGLPLKKILKLLAANRSEIAIRVFRSAHELGIRTVAVYSHEDRYALHRFKADEAYPIGRTGEPVRAYLDIEGILAVCREHDVDAIHPGYGFLSENPDLTRACARAGITFVGPRVDLLEKLGDKIAAREIARSVGVPVLSGGAKPVRNLDDARRTAERLGFPVILKAAKGGGGRGMRVVAEPSELSAALESAQRESEQAFGSSDVFLEKLVERARHIEVQLLGDQHGNLVHLFERDCSLQRRHQKMVEVAPALNLDPPCATPSVRRRWKSVARCAMRAPAPSSFCSIRTPASTTSSKSTRVFRSSTRSRRW